MPLVEQEELIVAAVPMREDSGMCWLQPADVDRRASARVRKWAPAACDGDANC